MSDSEQAFQTQLQRLQAAIGSDQPAQTVGKSFVQGISSSGAGPRFDEHDYALCSRVLTQCIYDFYNGCLQRKEAGNWFVPRETFAGQQGNEGETELGVIFAVCPGILQASRENTLRFMSLLCCWWAGRHVSDSGHLNALAD